jgi:hypothetical protein
MDVINRDEILLLARHAGLDLPAEYHDALIEVFGHVQAMVARIPKPRPRQDEPAHVFVAARFLPTGQLP